MNGREIFKPEAMLFFWSQHLGIIWKNQEMKGKWSRKETEEEERGTGDMNYAMETRK